MVKVAHVQLCSCCGCLVSLADTYEKLLDVLNSIELVYCQTLADAREIPECDIALVEGSVCLDDHHSLEVAQEVRKKAKIVVALGACAATGGVTRYCKGNQLSKPVHSSFSPLTEVIKVDLAIPGCPPSPEAIVGVITAALNGDMEYLQPYAELAEKGSEACGCDVIYKVVNKSLCMGCGTCAAACPTRAIEMLDGRPNIIKELCIKCGACSVQCPRIRFPELIEKIE
ncbi:coenzyme F420 hydrogenase, subunit gamma [Methanocaldococcus sp. FS406-22]|uniref:coenzyme F420 hydrogenase subunit gamma n=1 Tax=Methanocaldococcus sp. (strain FS406-22) TaxID=644281 RepID=UPI0001BF4FBC|nr:coenzyme F420 hydrogenase subunit gamma [Methanocaldococcus sp. FS406-22]ADC69629.1 coenzyme F420 hydrogenase, subunit gamma [Methanocaldococcus sp. FS406-22]